MKQIVETEKKLESIWDIIRILRETPAKQITGCYKNKDGVCAIGAVADHFGQTDKLTANTWDITQNFWEDLEYVLRPHGFSLGKMIAMNDALNMSFKEIADAIEQTVLAGEH